MRASSSGNRRFSGSAALLVVRTFLDFVARNGFALFAYWRIAVGTIGLIALAVYASYLVYRWRFTINPEAPVFSWLVFLAEVHGFLSLGFYFTDGNFFCHQANF